MLAPCILNVDKGIRAWNAIFGKDDKLNPTSTRKMNEIANSDDTEGANKFSILSGTNFGSSFVGMVHVVNTTTTNVKQSLDSMAVSLQAQMQKGLWFKQTSGGFGVEASFGDEVKSLLSTQSTTSHVTMICMGVIPSIVASNVPLDVKQFTSFDPKSSMEAVASIENATLPTQSWVGEAVDAARTGQKMVELKSSDLKASLSALGDIDDKACRQHLYIRLTTLLGVG